MPRDAGYALRADYYNLEFDSTADFELVRDVVADASVVLDVPCGSGRLLPLHATLSADVIMVDAEPRMTAICVRRIRDLGLLERVSAHTDDIRALRLERRPQAIIVPHGGLQTLATLRDVSTALECLVSGAAAGATLYVDIANPWDADAADLSLLSPFMRMREDGAGDQVFADHRVKMKRSWHSKPTDESLEVSFAYEITTHEGVQLAHYEAWGRWLRVRPDFLLTEFRRLGVETLDILGHHDGRRHVPGSPRLIAVGRV